MFLANYADGLTDFPLPSMIDHFMAERKDGRFLWRAARPTAFTWCARRGARGDRIQHVSFRPHVNGGYFIFRKKSSTTSATARSWSRSRSAGSSQEGLLAGYRHDGFWLPMDTFKDKQLLEDMYSRGVAPWEVWKNGASLGAASGRRRRSAHGTPTVEQERVI